MAIVFPQIGGQYFCSMRGEPDQPGEQVQDITPNGSDGTAFQKIGKRGVPSHLDTMAVVETSTAAEALKNTYKALQGTVVSIITANETEESYMILEVNVVARSPIVTPIRGVTSSGTSPIPWSSAWLVEARWSIQFAGIPI